MQGEINLWIAVIETAFRDAAQRIPSHAHPNEQSIIKRQAYTWLTKPNQGFHEVCAMAQLEPEWVRRKFNELLRRDSI